MDGMLHLVQRRGHWVGPLPAQAPPCCTKCKIHPSTASVPTSYYSMYHYNSPLESKGLIKNMSGNPCKYLHKVLTSQKSAMRAKLVQYRHKSDFNSQELRCYARLKSKWKWERVSHLTGWHHVVTRCVLVLQQHHGPFPLRVLSACDELPPRRRHRPDEWRDRDETTVTKTKWNHNTQTYNARNQATIFHNVQTCHIIQAPTSQEIKLQHRSATPHDSSPENQTSWFSTTMSINKYPFQIITRASGSVALHMWRVFTKWGLCRRFKSGAAGIYMRQGGGLVILS